MVTLVNANVTKTEPIPQPEQDSYIAAGMGVAAMGSLVLTACCVPLAVVSLILGAGAAYLGWRMNEAVNRKTVHAVNQSYALVGLLAGGIATLSSLFTLIMMVISMVVYALVMLAALLSAGMSA